jgi:WD40 repeat protein
VWNAEGGEPIATFGADGAQGDLNRARFSPDGRLVVTADEAGAARVWDVERRTLVQTFNGHLAGLFTAAFSRDGTRLITAGGVDGTVKVWNAKAGGDAQWSADVHNGVVTGASFSPDDRAILTTGGDGLATVRGLDSKIAVSLKGHDGVVRSGAFSRDGRFIVTTSGDMTARVWDAETGAELVVLRGHTSRLSDAVFSPDGRLVVTASADTTARVWEWASARLLAVLDHHADHVTTASFSPDGLRVLTSSDDGTARIVECHGCYASVDALIDEARARVGPPLLDPPGFIERLRRLVSR